MLIVKVQVNNEQIDEIHIQNIKHIVDGIYQYRIRKPEGFDATPIHHKRTLGYKPLLIEALSILKHTGG